MRVAVIGAGVAGAAAARILKREGHEPVVLEAADGIGGRVRTVEHNGFEIDSGAIFVMGSYARTRAVLREQGRMSMMRRWHARTAVLDGAGRKHRVRLDRPWTLLRLPQLTIGDRLRAVRQIGRLALGRDQGPFDIDDLAAADDGRTLDRWSRDSLGDRTFEYVVRPLMDPLTGADPRKISAGFVKTLLTQVHRTQLTVPDGGLGRIAEWLLDGVDDVRIGTPALSLERHTDGITVLTADGPVHADAAVLATDVRTAAALLDGVVDSAITDALSAVVPVTAHHVVFGYHRDPWPDVPYDLVVHGAPGVHHNYGVLLNGRRAPRSVPTGAQTASVWLDAAQTDGLSEVEVVARARLAVAMAFSDVEPDFTRIFPMDVALIAPVPGHYAAMRTARDSMPANLRLAGDFLTHSGIEAALLAGERAAKDLLGAGADNVRQLRRRGEIRPA
ncbi:FAD-dependent oxidoreductase [Rhodococcus sp. NPDC006774]|jgi:oxygen-dependent protoporphyrinogen oxidase|uniref:FAD-dependent oxidoreductase n=1 Tax=Rhodococcus sp. NPDC006774 TaxID=3157186 RepID=UPI0033C574FD